MERVHLLVLLVALLGLVGSANSFITPAPPSCAPRRHLQQPRGQHNPRRRPESVVVMEVTPRSSRQQQQTRKDVLAQGLLGLTAGALALGCVRIESNAYSV